MHQGFDLLQLLGQADTSAGDFLVKRRQLGRELQLSLNLLVSCCFQGTLSLDHGCLQRPVFLQLVG
jgi:hypothetical protein